MLMVFGEKYVSYVTLSNTVCRSDGSIDDWKKCGFTNRVERFEGNIFDGLNR